MKSLTYALIKSGKIRTTEAKAKELKPMIEKLVTRAKSDTVSNRRIITAKVGEKEARNLIAKIAPKYGKRAGGYTRITKLPARKTDGSKMAVIEFV